MRYILSLLMLSCTASYPMRRTYGSCDAMLDRLNFLGGPLMLFLFVVLFIILRAILQTNKK